MLENGRKMDKTARNDALSGVLILLVTGAFASVTSDIYVDPLDPGFSSVDFPIMVLSLLTAFSLTLIGKSIPALWRSGWKLYEPDEASLLLKFVVPLVLAGGVYIALMTMFQYPLPTFAATVVALVMFDNRGWTRLLVIPLIAALGYYIVFYALLGLHEPPGTVWAYETRWFTQSIRDFFGIG
jgi:hypothetical protein